MTAEAYMLNVEGKSIRITHPGKVMFPEKGYTKRDVVDYYLDVKEILLKINAGRPSVFVRYPQGAGGYSFFQKNVPAHHPGWMEIVRMGKHKLVDYLVINGIAGLIWFVQMHTLEFHVLNIRKPHWESPDLMVFDLDPPAGASFVEVRDFALEIKPVLEALGYRPFVKTSGKRGVHIVCPVLQKYTVYQVFKAAEDVAKKIIERFPRQATLELRKDKRASRFLVDIYRNRAFQTFSMPLGLRATPQAAVSMPLDWDELKALKKSVCVQHQDRSGIFA